MQKLLGHVPNDGYTEHGYIREIPRISPAVRFKFRPTPHEEFHSFQHDQRNAKKAQAAVLAASFLSGKIVEWDLKDEKDEPMPRSARSVLRLKEVLYERLLGIVTGLESSDEDPKAAQTDSEKDQSIAELLDAQESNKLPSEVRQANDEKN